MTEVALAFSNIDKPRADALARILNAVGYEVAAQPLTPEKVDRAAAVLAFWSPSSINSQPVQNFASQAAFSKKLVSVRAGPADPPAAFALVTLHDLSSWTGSLDAPELRTLVSHVAKMAPPTPQQQQQPLSQAPGRFGGYGGMGFSGNGFDPYAAPAPAPVPRPAPRDAAPQPAVRDAAPPREATPAPASYRDRPARPERRTAEEPRRAAGGGVARMAFGAIAVTVMGGGAVAAFNYYGDGQTGASTADAPGGAEILTAAPSAPIETPAATAAEEQTVQVAANSYTAPAETVVAGPTVAAAATPPVTVQSGAGWTATLPSTPPAATQKAASTRTPTMTATPVSGGAAAPARPQRDVRLPPIGGAAPQPADIVAVDRANFGDENVRPAPAPPAQPERVWQRPDVTYGPDS